METFSYNLYIFIPYFNLYKLCKLIFMNKYFFIITLKLTINGIFTNKHTNVYVDTYITLKNSRNKLSFEIQLDNILIRLYFFYIIHLSTMRIFVYRIKLYASEMSSKKIKL